jgi:hypothetical protein
MLHYGIRVIAVAAITMASAYISFNGFQERVALRFRLP